MTPSPGDSPQRPTHRLVGDDKLDDGQGIKHGDGDDVPAERRQKQQLHTNTITAPPAQSLTGLVEQQEHPSAYGHRPFSPSHSFTPALVVIPLKQKNR